MKHSLVILIYLIGNINADYCEINNCDNNEHSINQFKEWLQSLETPILSSEFKVPLNPNTAIPPLIGMISNKLSITTIFGHKHFLWRFQQKTWVFL